MSRRDRRLSRPPAGFAALVASGDSYSKIAEKIGVGRDIVSAWANRPGIQKQVEEIQKRAAELTVKRLSGLQDRAVDALHDVLISEGATVATARAKAAAEVFDRTGIVAKKGVELSGSLDVDLDTRTDAELDRDVLTAAADIVLERGRADLADAIRELANERPDQM